MLHVLPMDTKSKMEAELPNRDCEKMLIELPNLLAARMLVQDASSTKFNTEQEEPIWILLQIDIELPILETALIDTADAKHVLSNADN
jgi:hypothetical protein